ncbi:MAG: HlyD family efflux transporter periplasmic adaptor subunit [Thioploca sp.]|nr:HlyD family efflux transporter periplasmic adaptor subunit [Thioploca sp.]
MRIYFFSLIIILCSFSWVMAHEGHDHGPALPPLPTQTLTPRVEVKSADFELVGIVGQDEATLTIYLDVFATNEPINQAKIEVEESGLFKAIAKPSSVTGTYLIHSQELTSPGKHELVFTIETEQLADLLLGELTIPPPQDSEPVSKLNTHWWLDFQSHWLSVLFRWQVQLGEWLSYVSAGSTVPSWFTWGLLVMVIIVGLLIRHWVIKIRWQRSISAITPWLVLTGIFFAVASMAHEGEDHSEPASHSVATPWSGLTDSTAIRLPDGSVFMPKPIQRLLNIRTYLTKTTPVAQGVELYNGHIIADPSYSGIVQAPLAGRIELTAAGLPHLGQKVDKDQILAYLIPIAGDVDRAGQQVEIVNLAGQVELVKKNINRLKQLGNNIARKELEDAQVELSSLQQRQTTLAASLTKRIPLTYPITGVIAVRNVLVGQVVEAREILVEIINPDKLWVEALVYDPTWVKQIVTAQAITTNQQVLSLSLVGLTYQLREHALPLQFRITSPLPFLAVEQPVKVFASLKQTLQGIALPNSAVLKGNNSQSLVWVHESAEHFQPVTVSAQAVDANQVVVIAGLKANERVVIEGASLLGQVR